MFCCLTNYNLLYRFSCLVKTSAFCSQLTVDEQCVLSYLIAHQRHPGSISDGFAYGDGLRLLFSSFGSWHRDGKTICGEGPPSCACLEKSAIRIEHLPHLSNSMTWFLLCIGGKYSEPTYRLNLLSLKRWWEADVCEQMLRFVGEAIIAPTDGNFKMLVAPRVETHTTCSFRLTIESF